MRSAGSGEEKRNLSEQLAELPGLEPAHDLADILGAVARAEKQRVGGFDHDEIADADSGDEFPGAPEEIPRRIEREMPAGGNVFAGICGQQLVDSSPGADVAPTHFGRDYEDSPGAASLGC